MGLRHCRRLPYLLLQSYWVPKRLRCSPNGCIGDSAAPPQGPQEAPLHPIGSPRGPAAPPMGPQEVALHPPWAPQLPQTSPGGGEANLRGLRGSEGD